PTTAMVTAAGAALIVTTALPSRFAFSSATDLSATGAESAASVAGTAALTGAPVIRLTRSIAIIRAEKAGRGPVAPAIAAPSSGSVESLPTALSGSDASGDACPSSAITSALFSGDASGLSVVAG